MFLNSFSLLQVTEIYFSRLILSRTSETKSSNWYVMVFIALTYKKYLPKIMRWLRAKQASSSHSSSFILLKIEYHSCNLFQKELACVQFMNKCHRVWHSEGQKGQEGEATFFILCNKLFVGKIRWMILYWNIVSFNSLVALNGRR